MSTLASPDVCLLDYLPVRTPPHPLCRAVVVIPARNEEDVIRLALEGLCAQVDLRGDSLDWRSYEVWLLLNNCTDRSMLVAQTFQQEHPGLALHVAECILPKSEAHVGTARRMLMDLACARLEQARASCEQRSYVILSTDADTVVAQDWIAQNLAAIDAGADAVGGVIHLFPGAVRTLDAGTRSAYIQDRDLQSLIARLESLLDPDPADPWPRHQQHFGASIACTPSVYRRSGGLPPVAALEDVAFVDALRKVDARIRHAPEVHIYTSARFEGRSKVGLAAQLRQWRAATSAGRPLMVDSAEWLEHRFRTMAYLRRLNAGIELLQPTHVPPKWRQSLIHLHAKSLPTGRFLEMLDSDALIEEAFLQNASSLRFQEMGKAIAELRRRITTLECAREHPVEIAHASGGG